MLFNKFDSKLFDLLNEIIYIIDFKDNKIIFENDKAKTSFGNIQDFNYIFKKLFKTEKDLNSFFSKIINRRVIRINEPFVYNKQKYCVFIKFFNNNDEKIILYLFKKITDKNEKLIFDLKNSNYFQNLDKSTEIYIYISRMFDLISNEYEDVYYLNNKENLDKYLKNLNYQNVTSLSVMAIKSNNFSEFLEDCSCNKAVIYDIKSILEKFFRSDDIYILDENIFIVVCKNIEKDFFYKKVNNLNNGILDLQKYNLSVGIVWENKATEFYDVINRAKIKMRKSEEIYLKKHLEKKPFFIITFKNLLNKDEMTTLEDVDFSLGFETSVIKNLNKFYKKVRNLLNSDKNFVMVMLDIDNFKSINEIYGFERGNEILNLLNTVLTINIENKGICTHFHSDIYYIFFETNTDKTTLDMIKKIDHDISKVSGNINISLIYGIYRVVDTKLSVEKMCEYANYAHKTIKQDNSSNNFIFYYNAIKNRFIQEQEIKNDMLNALVSGEFNMYLQPKYDIFNNKIEGAEALVRWCHPKKGLISPSIFIPIFEQNGFILKLDLYILEETCKFIKSRLDQNKKVVPISVNISKLHFYDLRFKDYISSIIKLYSIPPELIEIEVTESLLEKNIKQIAYILKSLRDKKIRIAIDDFGSGYSSLGILKDLDIDTLKIDSSFFKDFSNNKKSAIIIKQIVNLGHILNLNVVAEGVEKEEEIEYLRSINCKIVQGYYFSKPITSKDFEYLLDTK